MSHPGARVASDRDGIRAPQENVARVQTQADLRHFQKRLHIFGDEHLRARGRQRRRLALELAHAPKDRRTRDLHEKSSTLTGRRSRIEESAASATTSARRASATEQGLSAPSSTAPRNASSSARYAASKRSRKSL